MKPVYRLATVHVSHETVTALRALLAAAEAGTLHGVAYAAILAGRRVIVNSTGEAYRSPIFTLGVLRLLEDDLIDHARNNGD